MEVGKRIASIREKIGLSQKELGDRVGLHKSVMNRIESGDRPLKAEELSIIADLLNVTSDYLLGKSKNPQLTADQDQNKNYDEGTEELLNRLDKIPDKEERKDIINQAINYINFLSQQKKK